MEQTEEKEVTGIVRNMRNQVLTIVVVAALSGLGMNLKFILTINSTVTEVKNAQIEMRQQINEHDKKIYLLTQGK